jgi:hypothetical protein
VLEKLRTAHEKWIEAQNRLVAIVEANCPPDSPIDEVEGMRWAGRLTSMARDWIVEKNDPLRPTLFLQQNEVQKFIVDNPDVNYHFCRLDPAETYILRGNRGAAPYVGFTLGGDIFHWGSPDAGETGTVGQSHLDDYEIAENGDFEIVLSAAKHDGNWMPLPDAVHHLAVRETFTLRGEQRPAELHIERIGDPLPSPTLDADSYADKLETAANFIAFCGEVCAGMYAGTAGNLNCVEGASGAARVESPRDTKEDDVSGNCNTEMQYKSGRYRLEAGQALVVEVYPTEKPFGYWGITLSNPWAESIDYRYAKISINQDEAEETSAGTWRIVIAAEDPRVANWLDTGGRPEGWILMRWCLAPDAPNPVSHLVSIEELRSSVS